MLKTVTAVFAAVAILTCFATAAVSNAAPGDVRYVPSTAGDTITSTFTNRSAQPIRCFFSIYARPYVDGGDNGDYGVLGGGFTGVMTAGTVAARTVDDIPDGDVWIEWSCVTEVREEPILEMWGTPASLGGDATVPTVTLTVDSTRVPDPVCSGSACLPTGSFGL